MSFYNYLSTFIIGISTTAIIVLPSFFPDKDQSNPHDPLAHELKEDVVRITNLTKNSLGVKQPIRVILNDNPDSPCMQALGHRWSSEPRIYVNSEKLLGTDQKKKESNFVRIQPLLGVMVRHEIGHLKNCDYFRIPLIPTLVSVASVHFCKYFEVPYLASLSIATIAGFATAFFTIRMTERQADRFAFNESSPLELKEYRDHTLGLIENQSDTEVSVFQMFTKKVDWQHPSPSETNRLLTQILLIKDCSKLQPMIAT